MENSNTKKSGFIAPHNCESTMRKVMSALDGQLSSEEEQKFLAQVNECPHCLSRFDIEASFKKFLKNKIETKQVSKDCIDSIKSKIAGMKPE